jgi:hypothetical protein
MVDGKNLLKDEVHTSITGSIVSTQKNHWKEQRKLRRLLKLLIKKLSKESVSQP